MTQVFHRIRPTTSALLDPYNHRMVPVHEEEGFVCEERQANHLVATELAVIVESNVPSPFASAPEVAKHAAPHRAGKKKIDEELV